jgi:hypothetical protein
MNATRLVAALTAALALTLAAHAQQTPPNPVATACGPTAADYDVRRTPVTSEPTEPPPGKALVFVIESFINYPFVTKKVNIGLDGAWLGATDWQSHMSFTVDPGAHHLCAVYQGHAANMDEEGRTLLLHLNAQAGHVYYISYHALFLKDDPGIAFFEPVDEDEGQLLLQRTEQASSTLKK